ncbi:MAG TPA: site-2 protease family protein [Fimbriimonadaceae bacterium]|nr:site-2 protease family protein [Fimbriimonadaceae bacterium]
MIGDINPTRVIAQIIVIFFGIGLHEFAHCKFADLAGDPTPSYYGRVTLNLFRHFDPVGAVFILITILSGWGIGWGRPAPMNPNKMRNPRWDWFIAVIAGPLCNVLQAVVYAVALRLAIGMGAFRDVDPASNFLFLVLFLGVLTNLALATFNMIPLGPLDGKWLLGILLPERLRYSWFKLNDQFGFLVLFALIFLFPGALSRIMSGPITAAFMVLMGMHA